MQQDDVGSVVLLVCVLAFAVLIVDERWLRAAVAFVPALLLAQRSLSASEKEEDRVGAAAERRLDGGMRGSVDELLKHIRAFYLTCHLMSSGKISPDEAVERAAQQELELNRLLALVTDDARGRAGR